MAAPASPEPAPRREPRHDPGRTVMRAIVSWSLTYRFLVVAGAAALMLFGIATVRNTPVDVFPEFAPPQVEIQTESLGLSTSDVESLVTVPLERGLNGIPGLDQLRSTSVPQLSSIVMVFKPGTDLLHARQLVAERLGTVRPTLPKWASPPVMLPPVSATARALQIGVTADADSISDLSRLTLWRVKPRLLAINGVADVSIWNERQPTLQVQVDPGKLAAQNATLDDVERTTSDALDSGALSFSTGNVVGAGGSVDDGARRLQLLHALSLSINNPQDLAKAPLEDQAANGKTVPLSAIGTVAVDTMPIIGDAVINGKPGLLLVVEKLPWGNTLQVTHDVQTAIAQLAPGLPGVHFDTTIFRPATFIDESIGNLRTSLLLGFALVAVILVLFLFEWRVAVISILTIPLSLTAALLVLHWSRATVNTMILAGLIIALGAVVDDAIIDVENILRRLRNARAAHDPTPTARIVLDASVEVRSPIVYATLIIVVAAVPVFLLHGLTAAFFRPLAFAYTLAIVASMLVALTVTPALTLIMLGRAPLTRHRSPLVGWLQRGYTALLARIVRRPAAAYSVFGVVVLAGLVIAPQLGTTLFPTFQQRDLLIHWDAIPGTSDAEVVRTSTLLSQRLQAIPGVRSFGAHIGRAIGGEEVVGVNAAEAWISTSPSADYNKVVSQVRDVVNSYPGMFRDVETYLNERIEEVLSGSKEAVIVRVYGEDLDTMRSTAAGALSRIATIGGVVDPHMDISIDTPQIQVEVDLAKAGRLGLKPGDVRRQAAALAAGQEMGNIFQQDEISGVFVWSTPATRADPQAIADVKIDTPGGGQVRLGDIANVTLKSDPYLVTHDDGARYIDVGANVEGRDLGAVVHDVQARLKTLALPQGVRYSLLGEYKERQAAQRSLSASAVVAAFAVLLLLQLAFGSWRPAALLFLTLPMALVGGVIAIGVSGQAVSIGALVGFFTVFGIAARNGILLVDHCRHLERHEGETFGPALVVRGARERLSPILMTSLATGLALVPLVLRGAIPGHEIEYPLAVVILGGLITSTLLTLFVVPSLYLRFGRPVDGGSGAGSGPGSGSGVEGGAGAEVGAEGSGAAKRRGWRRFGKR